MENILEIKRRMKGIKEIRHLTGAMKLVAATKLRKAQERVEASRPFAKKISEVVQDLYELAGKNLHPLMEVRTVKRVGLVVVTSDRGLCGAYNSNILRHALSCINALPKEQEVSIIAIGRKGRDFFRRRGYKLSWEFCGESSRPTFLQAAQIAELIMKEFLAREVDQVDIIYSRFYNAYLQKPRRFRLLPIAPAAADTRVPQRPAANWVFDPSPAELLDHLIPRYVEAQIYRALLEADVGEKGARMTSMGAASDNAEEIMAKLAQRYNRYRQTIITNELSELMGGVEGLREKES
ncbi:MAG TPA: ATP synthase F1 subunit gamma [Bacillota bacterium]